MILGYLIIGLFLFAIFHFIIDGIVAPSEHMISRQKLLEIAAEIKANKTNLSHDDKSVANTLFRSANTLIAHMPRYNILNLSKFIYHLKENPELAERARKRSETLNACDNEFLLSKKKGIEREADRVIAWNSMSWMLFIVPIALTAAFLGSIKKLVSHAVFFGGTLKPSSGSFDEQRFA